MKTEEVLISWQDIRLSHQTPDLSRCSMIDLADSGVEASYATEPSSEGNLTHWQPGLVDELLGKVQTARLSHRNRRRSQVS